MNVRLADGGVDFRSPHHTKVAKAWKEGRCQVCGAGITGRAVLFGGPNQVASLRFDEPPLCVPCAMYASKACPMVAGERSHYADRTRISEGHRGETCSDPGCDCGGWVATDPDAKGHPGDPAHDWFAVYIQPGAYSVLVRNVRTRCSDKGCWHDRQVVDGGQLTDPPLKVVLVSTRTEGRVWRKLPPEQWPTEVCER